MCKTLQLKYETIHSGLDYFYRENSKICNDSLCNSNSEDRENTVVYGDTFNDDSQNENDVFKEVAKKYQVSKEEFFSKVTNIIKLKPL